MDRERRRHGRAVRVGELLTRLRTTDASSATMRSLVLLTVVLGACTRSSSNESPRPAAEPDQAATASRRSVDELIVARDALSGFVEPLLASTAVDVVKVAPDEARSRASLERLQVTTHSTLGALVFYTGGLVLDHGWLRIVGGPTESFPYDPWTLAEAFGLAGEDPERAEMLIVGIDRLGGLFALDGGALGRPGKVAYFSPDSLRWEPLDSNHSEFVAAMVSGAVVDFYAESRWTGWQDEIANLEPSQGISMVPPPWTEESRPYERTTRRPVPFREIVGLELDVARQIGAAGE